MGPWPNSLQKSAVTVTRSGIGKCVAQTDCHSSWSFSVLEVLKGGKNVTVTDCHTAATITADLCSLIHDPYSDQNYGSLIKFIELPIPLLTLELPWNWSHSQIPRGHHKGEEDRDRDDVHWRGEPAEAGARPRHRGVVPGHRAGAQEVQESHILWFSRLARWQIWQLSSCCTADFWPQ